MIRREMNAIVFNAIINDPGVMPYVSMPGQKALDASALVVDWRNALYLGPGGGVLAVWSGDRSYEMHLAFLPHARGMFAVAIGEAVLGAMFGEMRAERLFGRIADHNRRARAYAHAMGFQRVAGSERLGWWRGSACMTHEVELTCEQYGRALAVQRASRGETVCL